MTALLKPFARLWTPGQVKPTGVPRIDWSDPLTQGLVFYGFDTGLGLIVDLARGRTMQSVSASGGPTPVLSADQWGGGFLYDANHTNYFASDAEIRNLTAAPPWTCACALDQLTLTNGAICFCRTANNSGGQPYMDWCFQTDFSAGAHTTFAVNSGGIYSYIGTAGSTGTAIGANGFHSLVGVANSSSSASYFVDGVSQGTTAGLSIQSINIADAICFGGNSSASVLNPCASAFVPYGAYWSRALSSSEILQLHLDPYCFLLPGEGEMPALNLSLASIALWGRSLAIAAGRASLAGRTALSGRGSTAARGAPPMSGAAALSAASKVATTVRGAVAGTAFLAGRAGASVRGLATASGRVALAARAPAVSTGRAALSAVAALLALAGRSGIAATARAAIAGTAALAGRAAASATARLVSTISNA